MRHFYHLLPYSVILFSNNQSFASSEYFKNISDEREKLVISIKSGNVQTGLSQLKHLYELYPEDQKILADYLVLSLQNHNLSKQDQLLLNNISGENFPEYAKIPLIKLLRDAKDFPQALQLAKKFESYSVDEKLKVLIAVLYAENHEKDQAIRSIKKMNLEHYSTDQIVQLSYAYRISDQPIQALALIQNLKKGEGRNLQLETELLNVLLALGANQQVLEFLAEHPDIDPDNSFQQQARLSQLSIRIKDAIKSQKYLSAQGESDQISFKQLDQVLSDAEALLLSISNNPNYLKKMQYEYIYALGYRGRHLDVLNVVKNMPLKVEQMPAYIRNTVADAYLALKQPQKAEELYGSLVTEKNYSDMSVYSSWYYALIDQEKYKQANQLMKEVDKKIPTFQYSLAKGVDKKVHPDRAEYIGLKEMANAYSNQLELAEKNLKNITIQTPNNEEYLNALARVQRWRELPQHAQATLNRLNGIEPISKTTQINQMQNLQALGDTVLWRDQIKRLSILYPNDTSVMKSVKELNDRQDFSIVHESRFSKSKANQDQVLDSLKGTKDLESFTRLNSPWFLNNYRTFAQYTDRMGSYRDGKIHEERVGIGAQWESKQKSLTFMASQELDGDRTGLSLDWNQRLNDFWQYHLSFSNQGQIPLQALKDNSDAKSYGLGIQWQANESKKASIQYQALDINDGNLRQELSSSYQQVILTAPKHTTRAGVSGYFAKNRLDNTSYFSPKTSYSLALDLNHDWITWRNDDRSLTQKISIMTGLYDQNKFSPKTILDVQYSHNLQLSRTWGLHYGIGWLLHPYDGVYEKQWYGNLGFEGKF